MTRRWDLDHDPETGEVAVLTTAQDIEDVMGRVSSKPVHPPVPSWDEIMNNGGKTLACGRKPNKTEAA